VLQSFDCPADTGDSRQSCFPRDIRTMASPSAISGDYRQGEPNSLHYYANIKWAVNNPDGVTLR
jgi:hypothetical protein